ncbi:hypothetical protein D3C76_1854480 [compost metagenome]
MESVIKRDNLGLIRAMTGDGVMTSELESRFVSLRTGIGEKHPVGEGGSDQFAGQAQRGLIGEHVAGMP